MRADALGTALNGSVRPVMATTDPWPAILIGVGLALVACLWSLFRRGSIADRARDDAELLDGLDPSDPTGGDPRRS